MLDGATKNLIGPELVVRERAAGDRLNDTVNDSSERTNRMEMRAESKEVEKDAFIKVVRELVRHRAEVLSRQGEALDPSEPSSPAEPDLFRIQDKARRLEKNYSNKGVRKFDKYLASADTKGNLTVLEELKRRGTKVAIKTGISGALGLTAAGVLGGLSVATLGPILAGVGIGAAGRGLYELYRTYKGNERSERNKIEQANEAVIQKVEELVDECATLQLEMFANPETLDATTIETDPKYKALIFEIAEMMYDDTARRAKEIVDLEGRARYIGLRRDEGKNEEGNDQEKVVNIGLAEGKLRQMERRAETKADLIALITSVGGSALTGFLAAQNAGQEAAKRAGEKLINGQVVGPYDFDKLRIPDSAFAHKVQIIANDIKPYFDTVSHIWHDSLSNLTAAIGKSETAVAMLAQGKAAVSVLVGGLVQFFVNQSADRDSRPFIEKEKAQVVRAKELFGATEKTSPENDPAEGATDAESPKGDASAATEITSEEIKKSSAEDTVAEDAEKTIENLTPDHQKILDRLEKDKDLTDEQINRLRSAAGWVLSRLNKEQFESLDAKDQIDRDIKFRELAKLVLKNEIVTHYSRVSPDGRVRYPDLDGTCAIGLFRLAGIEIDDSNKAMFVPAGESIEGKVMIDTGGTEGVYDNFDMGVDNLASRTGGADHHAPYSGKDSSGTKLVYEILTGLGMIDEEQHPYLKNMVKFVTQIDNAAFAGEKDTYLNSWKTLVGLSRYIKYDKLVQFFKEGKDPKKELTEEELIRYGLKGQKKDKNGLAIVGQNVDRSLEMKEKIDFDRSEIKKIEADGLIIDTGDPAKFGKIVVDVGNHLKLGYETTRYFDYDTYILWHPVTESFFISSKNPFPDNFTLSQGVRVRENMWIKGKDTPGELRLKLKGVLAVMVGEVKITPSGELKETFEAEDKWESTTEAGLRPEDEAMSKEYWIKAQSQNLNVETLKEKYKQIISNAAKTGAMERDIRSSDEIDEDEKQRFSALRVLARDTGYKVGPFSVIIRNGVSLKKAWAKVEKLAETSPLPEPKIEPSDTNPAPAPGELKPEDKKLPEEFIQQNIEKSFDVGGEWVLGEGESDTETIGIDRADINGVMVLGGTAPEQLTLRIGHTYKITKGFGEDGLDPDEIGIADELSDDGKVYIMPVRKLYDNLRPKWILSYSEGRRGFIKNKYRDWLDNKFADQVKVDTATTPVADLPEEPVNTDENIGSQEPENNDTSPTPLPTDIASETIEAPVSVEPPKTEPVSTDVDQEDQPGGDVVMAGPSEDNADQDETPDVSLADEHQREKGKRRDKLDRKREEKEKPEVEIDLPISKGASSPDKSERYDTVFQNGEDSTEDLREAGEKIQKFQKYDFNIDGIIFTLKNDAILNCDIEGGGTVQYHVSSIKKMSNGEIKVDTDKGPTTMSEEEWGQFLKNFKEVQEVIARGE